jgi:sarcosine oxidase subunit gamma
MATKAPTLRANPCVNAMTAHRADWTSARGMATPARFAAEIGAHGRALGVLDLSWRQRGGCKGPACAELLAQRGLPVPETPNGYVEIAGGGLVARLGRNEFLIEDVEGDSLLSRLGSLEGVAGAYPVLRQDASLLLFGSRLEDLLLQTCSFDFAQLASIPGGLALTSMIGVGVTALWQQAPVPLEGAALRIWLDGTYGDYVWSTLVEIAEELGGGPVGLAATR